VEKSRSSAENASPRTAERSHGPSPCPWCNPTAVTRIPSSTSAFHKPSRPCAKLRWSLPVPENAEIKTTRLRTPTSDGRLDFLPNYALPQRFPRDLLESQPETDPCRWSRKMADVTPINVPRRWPMSGAPARIFQWFLNRRVRFAGIRCIRVFFRELRRARPRL